MSTAAITGCASCGLPLDYATCPNCGHQRKRMPWQQPTTAPVVENLTRQALERDEHRCCAIVVGGDRCPTTVDLTVVHLDAGPMELANVGRLVTLCRRHVKETQR